jgi:hypothetical protein
MVWYSWTVARTRRGEYSIAGKRSEGHVHLPDRRGHRSSNKSLITEHQPAPSGACNSTDFHSNPSRIDLNRLIHF